MLRTIRVLAVSALAVLLAIIAARGAPFARAQSAATPDQLVRAMILGREDATGYRLRSSNTPGDGQFALAKQVNVFEADGSDPRISGTASVYAYVFATPDDAHAFFQEEVRQYAGGGGGSVLDLPGADEANVFYTPAASGSQPKSLVGWRRGALYFDVVTSMTVVAVARSEALRVASLQNAKAARIAPAAAIAAPPPSAPTPVVTVPTPAPSLPTPAPVASATPAPAPIPSPTLPPTPAPPAPATPSDAEAPATPPVFVMVTAQTGGALARDGTSIKAMIGGTECGAAQTINGFAFLSVASSAATTGCGDDGAVIAFTIGDAGARQTVRWTRENIALVVGLTSQGGGSGGGRVAVPVLDVVCRPPDGASACSAGDRVLWAGNVSAWDDELATRGEDPSAAARFRAWMSYRAARGEIFANWALAVLDEQPYTFISAVQFAPSAEEPEPYVSLITVGAAHDVGGWRVETGSGATYTFPDGTTLPDNNECRVYANPDAAGTSSTCAGAAFSGGDPALGTHGSVSLRNDRGEDIDLPIEW